MIPENQLAAGRSRLRAMSSLRMLAGVAVTFALLSGCPDMGDPKPLPRCAKAYDKCSISPGVLGLCEPIGCQIDQPPPCFVCRSQH